MVVKADLYAFMAILVKGGSRAWMNSVPVDQNRCALDENCAECRTNGSSAYYNQRLQPLSRNVLERGGFIDVRGHRTEPTGADRGRWHWWTRSRTRAGIPENLVMRDSTTGDEVTRIPVGSDAFRQRYRYPYGVICRAESARAEGPRTLARGGVTA
jgi:hypothetical protein